MKLGIIDRIRSLSTSILASLELEAGEFGLRAIPKGIWKERHLRYCREHEIHELHFNHAKGYMSDGRYDFFSDMKDLEGVKFVDPMFVNLSPLYGLMGVRSIDLSFVGKVRKGVDFNLFSRLERLKILSRVPAMDSVFQCKGLRQLALSHYPGVLESALFANLEHIENLFLSAVKLSDVDGLSHLVGLQSLTISGARDLSSLEGISSAHDLRRLELEYCPNIKSLSVLASAKNLEELWLLDCGDIDSLSYLEGCLTLKKINILGNTTIVDGKLDVLQRLPNLEVVCVVSRGHYIPSAISIERG